MILVFAAGEEGRLAYEQLDTVPGEMIRLGTRRGNDVTTAFWTNVPLRALQITSHTAWPLRTALPFTLQGC